jgi:hypothetical protein
MRSQQLFIVAETEHTAIYIYTYTDYVWDVINKGNEAREINRENIKKYSDGA